MEEKPSRYKINLENQFRKMKIFGVLKRMFGENLEDSFVTKKMEI